MPVPVFPARHPRRLLRDLTFETIRDAIVDGTLTPGERLFEDDLATWLGVSKTPVKEALARLSSHDLVKIEANRYTRVATADDLDLLDTLELIGVLHAEAVRSLARSGSASAEALAERTLAVLDEGPTCLGLVQATAGFLELARNPLVRRAAEPLDIRAAFLCRHLSIDWTRPALVGLLADLRTALDDRDWPRTADALVRLFRRASLRDAIEVVPSAASRTPDLWIETRARS
ncbi:GntR family transcriptional regulator [Frigoribacterium sp. ACAM 257]|uniref:GntR family transcriptional regulator n=1 Tax=Frigoribacterium sp. ACAM 257 TaxID=2508998 RepID=UPI0011BA1E50|nr:GntR family transcriptional regulator [Frigoribacterium sp. ACAM 257]TWX38367.1 GntR family transcriptional regulator [Frigoribacterium sp. ACAM 257]